MTLSKYARPNDETIASIERASGIINAFRDRDHRMTSSYIAAFLMVARFPGEGPSFYASKLRTTQPVASRTLQEIGDNARLRKEGGLGLVDSEIDPGNRRQHRYFLTIKGRNLLKEVLGYVP